MFVLVASLAVHVWPMNCIPRLYLGFSPPSQNKNMDAKFGYELGLLFLRGYYTWLRCLTLLGLDTTPACLTLAVQLLP